MPITPAPLDERQRLFDIIATRSFRQGETFTLASGRTSTIYFNLKPTMLYPEGARLIGTLMARKATALRPLLSRPRLRAFNHLITDTQTVLQLI